MAKLFVYLGLISGVALTLWSCAQRWNRDGGRRHQNHWLQPLVVYMVLLIVAAAVPALSRE